MRLRTLSPYRIVQARILPLERQQRQTLITLCLLFGDAFALEMAFWGAYRLRFEVLPYFASFDAAQYTVLVTGMAALWLAIFAAFQLYHPNTLFGGLREYAEVFNGVTTGTVLIVLLDFFLLHQNWMVSRGWLALAWLLTGLAVGLVRFLFRRLVYWLRRNGHLLSPTIIVGANAEGIALAKQLQNWRTSGLNIRGLVDDSLPSGAVVLGDYRVLGRVDELGEIVIREKVQDVIVAHTALDRKQLLSVFRSLAGNPSTNMSLSSGLFEIISSGLRVKELAYVPLIEVNKLRISGLDTVLKAMMDYLITIVGLLVIWPVLLVIAISVKRDSPGPVIHRRRVMGVNGTEFDAFKFRTMLVDGDKLLEELSDLRNELACNFKLKHDPRVTRVGNFLRKCSLDELPQLFNVLLGQMSLVGPRMISPPEMDKYGKWGMNLLTVKPGLTGLWQVSGRSDVNYEERVQMDMEYVRNWTIWMDLYLLLATFPAILLKRGAY